MVCLKKEILEHPTFLHLQNMFSYLEKQLHSTKHTIELSKATNFKANGQQKTSNNYRLQTW